MSDGDVTSKARQLLQESMAKRLEVVQTASEKAQLRENLQQQLASAEVEMEAAWKAAIDAGWDERELKRLGLAKPGTRVRRPRTGRARNNDTEQPRTSHTDDAKGSTQNPGDESN